MNVKALKEQKNELITQAETLLNRAVTEVRALDNDEQTTYEVLQAQIETLNQTITEAEVRSMQGAKVEVIENKIEKGNTRMNKQELRTQFLDAVSRGAELGNQEVEVRDYSTAEGKGGEGVKFTLAEQVLKAIDNFNPILPLANVIRTQGTHRLVVDASPAVEARLVAEGAPISAVDHEFKKIELGAYKIGEISKVTNEIAQDANFDIQGHIAERLGLSLAKAIEKYLVSGTGSNQPQGLVVAKGAETTTSGASVLALEDITKAFYALPGEVRKNAIFLCHPTVVQALALLEDANGRPLLTPSIDGEFSMVYGKRIVETPYLDEVGTGSGVCAMFVNVERALVVGLRQDISIRQLAELYAANDLLAIVGLARFDSKVVHDEAVSKIKLGA